MICRVLPPKSYERRLYRVSKLPIRISDKVAGKELRQLSKAGRPFDPTALLQGGGASVQVSDSSRSPFTVEAQDGFTQSETALDTPGSQVPSPSQEVSVVTSEPRLSGPYGPGDTDKRFEEGKLSSSSANESLPLGPPGSGQAQVESSVTDVASSSSARRARFTGSWSTVGAGKSVTFGGVRRGQVKPKPSAAAGSAADLDSLDLVAPGLIDSVLAANVSPRWSLPLAPASDLLDVPDGLLEQESGILDDQPDFDISLTAGQRSPAGTSVGLRDGDPESDQGSGSGSEEELEDRSLAATVAVQPPKTPQQPSDLTVEKSQVQESDDSRQSREVIPPDGSQGVTHGSKGLDPPVIVTQPSKPTAVSAEVKAIETQYAQSLVLLQQQQSAFMAKVRQKLASLDKPRSSLGQDQSGQRKPPACIKKPPGTVPSVPRGSTSSSVPPASGPRASVKKGPPAVPEEVAPLYRASNAATGLPPVPVSDSVVSASAAELPTELKGYEVDLAHFCLSDLAKDSPGQSATPAVDLLANPQVMLQHLSAGMVPQEVQLLARTQLLRQSGPAAPQSSASQSRLRSTDLGAKPLAELTKQVDFIQKQVLAFMVEEQAWDEPPVADPPNTAFQPAKSPEADEGPAVQHGMPVPAMLARHVLECWERPKELRPSRIVSKVPRLWRGHFDTFCAVLSRPSKCELDAFHLTMEGFLERIRMIDRAAGFRQAGSDLRNQCDLLRVSLNSAAWVQFQVASQTDCYKRLGSALDALQKVPGVPDQVVSELTEAHSNVEGQLLASWCQFCVCFAGVDCAARCVAALVLQLRTDACHALWGQRCPKQILNEVLAGPVNSSLFFGQDITGLMGKLAQHHTILQLNSAVAVQMGGEPMFKIPKRKFLGSSGPQNQGKKKKVDFRSAAQQGKAATSVQDPPPVQPFPGQGQGRGRRNSRKRGKKSGAGRGGKPPAKD